jgi:hypothetical protein
MGTQLFRQTLPALDGYTTAGIAIPDLPPEPALKLVDIRFAGAVNRDDFMAIARLSTAPLRDAGELEPVTSAEAANLTA